MCGDVRAAEFLLRPLVGYLTKAACGLGSVTPVSWCEFHQRTWCCCIIAATLATSTLSTCLICSPSWRPLDFLSQFTAGVVFASYIIPKYRCSNHRYSGFSNDSAACVCTGRCVVNEGLHTLGRFRLGLHVLVGHLHVASFWSGYLH